MATPDHTALARSSVPSDDTSTHPPGRPYLSADTAEALRWDDALMRIASGFSQLGRLTAPEWRGWTAIHRGQRPQLSGRDAQA